MVMKLKNSFGIMVLLACASTSSFSYQVDKGTWLVRARLLEIVPSVSSNQISVIGGEVTSASNTTVPELDFSYFFTQNIAAELILGISRHSLAATGTSVGNVDLGKATLLPPTLTLQYHYINASIARPYLGIGVNYTHFFNIDPGPVASSINYSDSWGPSVQLGSDFYLNNNWFINADIKKVYIKTSATVYAGAKLKANVSLNPMIYGLGIGYAFT